MEQEIERMLAESGRPSRFYVHRKSIIAASLVVLITNSIVEYAGIFRGKISASIMFFINIASAMVILAIVALTAVNNESEESMTSES